MNQEIEALKVELKSIVDDSIKANLASIVGEEVAEKVKSTVEGMRLERLLTGTDRSGVSDDAKIKFIEDINIRAPYLSQSDQAGGFLIPVEVHAGIIRIAATTGLIARDARKWPMASDTLEIPRYTGAVMQGEYVGEDDEGDETQEDLGVSRLAVKTWMNIFRIPNALLKNASVDVADWLMSMAAEGWSYKIDREGFTGGTYAGSPFVGLTASSEVTTQTLGSGATGFEDLSLEEASIAIGSLPTAALDGAAFYFNRTVWARIRTQKSGDNYVYGQSNLAAYRRDNGIQPVGLILDFPVYTTDVLPAYSASAISTKFGVFANLKLALAWGDKGPMEIAKSTDATVGGKSLFRANQTALRFTHDHAISLALPAAAVVLKTAAA